MTIRVPRPDEFERLRSIERAAGVLFAEAGLDDIAAHEPASVEQLAAYAAAGRAWVITDDTDAPVGYAVVDIVDDTAHLEQISVDPSHGRGGLGTALVEHVCTWAEETGYPTVTLTTFTDLPFNAPFYAHHGFAVMTDAEIGPELRALCALEAEHGLDPDRRMCMRRPL